MNEEFSDYELIVAKSDGGEITQDISWKVDKETDIVVWCDIAGLMEEGTFEYDGKSITINAYDRPFTAYIMRKECAEYVISQNANGTFSVDVILEQLQKNVRILEQLEETDTRTLQCVDAVKPITDKDNRIGKVLSFDDDGNPVCEVEVDDVEKIKAYRNEAQTSADDAKTSADNASKSESNASTTLLDIQTLVDGFDTEVANKQTEVIDAIDSHFSEKLYEKEIEFDEYTDSTIGEIEDIKNQALASAINAQASAINAQASANQAQALVDNALEIVDPEGFRQDTSANITDLQLFKANTGALHFNGGTLVVGASGTTDKMPSTFSWCRTLNITQQQWSNIANGRHFDTNSSSSAKGLSVFKTSNRLGFKYGDGTFTSGNILLSEDETNVIIDGKNHTLIIVGANERLRIYVDNILLRDVSVVGATTIPSTSYRYQIDRFTGQYSRIYNFNFDITSEDAPYTIADYQQGKPIPPSLLNGTDISLALEDYIIANGNSKIVFDYSGNNNDATITGDVKGDNDNRVQRLIDFIKA